MRIWMMGLAVLAGLFGAAGVGLAAAGAHVSGGSTVTTAANFLLFHAAALVGFCGLATSRRSRGVLLAASIVALGTMLFSGELALHTLAGVDLLQSAAPIGGTLMILGWLVAAFTLPIALGKSPGAR